ncbi:sensor domain-containing diguanylate cyclase [Idiomarina sp. A28L]|uniref:sensor domain-containing diguanylate cyclase n=1 Tax=Idiomarina sp. A28L TaxID=1036674 RepID=UPI00030ACED4|nr:diguanylate cyclase [Idiomarina sp. A28L]
MEQQLSWLRGIVICIAWVLLWRVSFVLEYAPFTSIWYPPAGLSFAAIVLYGWRGMVPVIVASYITAFWIDAMYGLDSDLLAWFFNSTSSTLAHVFSYAVGALFLRQFIRMHVIRTLPAIILGFLALGFITSLLASFFGIQVLISAGTLSIFNLYNDWLLRWVGDMVGVLVLTPLFLALLVWKTPMYSAWLRRLRISTQPAPIYRYAMKVTVNLTLLLCFIVLSWWFENPDVAFGVFFLVIPQMWIAYTENALRAVLSLTIFCVAIALGVALFSLDESAIIYQFAVSVIAITVYYGLAVPLMLSQSQNLQYQTQNDHLTGVANRSYFLDSAEEEFERSYRNEFPVCLLVFDICHFRAINNNYGHMVGDEVLVQVSKCLQTELRQSDIIGRVSSNSFMLLMPALPLDSAKRFAEQMLLKLSYINIERLKEPLNVKYSVIEIKPNESVDNAVQRVSESLHQKKAKENIYSRTLR